VAYFKSPFQYRHAKKKKKKSEFREADLQAGNQLSSSGLRHRIAYYYSIAAFREFNL
jgi:hypothetical protein